MYDGLIGDGKILTTELDFFVESVRAMRDIRTKRGALAADAFQKQMKEYFRLNTETANTFVFDDLIRLSETPAGTLLPRDDRLLDVLHQLRPGDHLTIDGQSCYFVRHMRLDPLDKRSGFFEYQYAGMREYRPMDYNVGWTLLQEGKMTIG